MIIEAAEAAPATSPTPMQPEQARSIERQAQLLAAAVRLLLSEGGSAVSHRRVAEASGSSPGAVRYYFRTREDLLAACLDRVEVARIDVADAVLAGLSGEQLSPEYASRLALEVYCGAELEDGAVAGMVWCIVDCSRESTRLSELLGEHRKAALQQLSILLQRCGYPAVGPRLVAAVIDGNMLCSTLERMPDAAEATTTQLAEIFRLSGPATLK